MWTATTRARSRTTWPIGRSRAMCATRHLRRTASRGTRKQHFAERLNLPAPSLSGAVTSGEGRLQVHFAQWGESVGGTKSHPTRAREGVTGNQHLARLSRCKRAHIRLLSAPRSERATDTRAIQDYLGHRRSPRPCATPPSRRTASRGSDGTEKMVWEPDRFNARVAHRLRGRPRFELIKARDLESLATA